jgi:hypothetical protein
MVVCIDPENGLFFRINTEPKWQTPVLLLKRDNNWLKHDSYLECGEPLELDDYIIEQSDPIGAVCHTAIREIVAAVEKSMTLSPADVRNIKTNLGWPE